MKKQIVTAIAIGITGIFPGLAQEENTQPEGGTDEVRAELKKEVKICELYGKYWHNKIYDLINAYLLQKQQDLTVCLLNDLNL